MIAPSQGASFTKKSLCSGASSFEIHLVVVPERVEFLLVGHLQCNLGCLQLVLAVELSCPSYPSGAHAGAAFMICASISCTCLFASPHLCVLLIRVLFAYVQAGCTSQYCQDLDSNGSLNASNNGVIAWQINVRHRAAFE